MERSQYSMMAGAAGASGNASGGMNSSSFQNLKPKEHNEDDLQ